MTVGVFCVKIQSGFPNPKKDFAFVWANPETDHEPLKSTLWVDSSDQIQIQIFEIHNLSVLLGKDLKKVFLTSNFPNKNGTQQMPFMYDILTEPKLVAPELGAISYIYHSMFVIYLYLYTVFNPLLVLFFEHM